MRARPPDRGRRDRALASRPAPPRHRPFAFTAGIALAVLVALATPLAGCGGAEEGDPALTVHVSAPLRGPDAAAGRALLAGARRALADAGGSAGGIEVRLAVHGDAGPRGWEAARGSAAARRAAEDSTAIAFIGEPRSVATLAALPITYAAGILQVAPAEEGEGMAAGEPARPGGWREYGHEAMVAILAAIEDARDPLDRDAVSDAFPGPAGGGPVRAA